MSDIHFDELQVILSNCILIDVRKQEEIAETGKLPGAFILPLHELEDALVLSNEEFSDKYGFSFEESDKYKVVYCRSGRRVGMAKEILAKKEWFDKLRFYFGSYIEWSAKGGYIEPLESDKSRKVESYNIEETCMVEKVR